MRVSRSRYCWTSCFFLVAAPTRRDNNNNNNNNNKDDKDNNSLLILGNWSVWRQKTHHKVAKAHSCESDHTKVNRLKVVPSLIMGEESSAACYHKYGKNTCGTHHFGLIHLSVLQADTLLYKLNAEGGKVVEAFAHRLKHNETQWNAHNRIDHAECFAWDSLWCAVTITFKSNQN